MKKLLLTLTVLACAPVLLSAQVVEEIVARVNNQIITLSEFQRSKNELADEVKQQSPSSADNVFADKEKDVLRDLIDKQLLIEKGNDLGITGDTDLVKRLDQMRKDMKLDTMEDLEKAATAQGISYEDFKQNMRDQIITQKVIGEEVGSHLSITNEEQQKFYDEHKSEMEQPETVRLSEIVIAPEKPAENPKPADNGAATGQTPDDTARQAAAAAALSAAEARANDLLKQIRAGANFEDLAKKYSAGPSAAQGGDLGVFKRGTLAKELEEKAFAMKSGEVTDVTRVKQGYLILKVTDHQMAGIPPMKDVTNKIQDAIYYQKLQPALRSYLTKLRENAYIDIKDGYVDSGASPNETKPIETSAAKESDAKNLKKKKKKFMHL
ncbi:MAG TPA: peptidylprolyl isomerase [Candidatus Sulfotelmatobacter sp.]|jgi:peptidyl-prolyl cis-trans isomerase SurA